MNDYALHFIAQNMTNLSKLDLTGCYKVTSYGIEYISKECGRLSELDLTECYGIDDESLFHLTRHCTSLTVLNMADCVNVVWDAYRLAGRDLNRLIHNNLKSLCLRHSKICDEGVMILCTIFPDLRILDLR